MVKNNLNTNDIFSRNKRLDLDTVATVFPLSFSSNHRSLVRLSVLLNEKVDVNKLQLALDNLLTKFPTFYVRLHQDRFSHYFERLESAPLVIELEEETSPLNMTIEDLKKCAFKVISIKDRIVLEYFHAISDGVGGSIFLKSLIITYLEIRYGLSNTNNKTLNKEEFKYQETIDLFPEIAGLSSKKDKISGTYAIKGKIGNIYITEFVFNANELVSKAKAYGVTVTALLGAILTAAIYDVQVSEGKNIKEIRLSIPIDLRRRFESETLRNFSLPNIINAGKLNKEMRLSDLCQTIDKQLKDSICKEKLSSHATSYVKLTRNKVIKYAPLFLKKWFVKLYLYIFKFGYSMTFSNLGVWHLPENIKPYIKGSSIAISPKPTTPYSCGVASVNNNLTLTLTRNIKEPLLETRIVSIINKVIMNEDFKLESIL